MNKKILQKIIDELKKDTPSIPYVLGILETLMESLPEEAEKKIMDSALRHLAGVEPVMTSGTELDRVAANKLSEIKRMAGDVS